MVERGRVIGTVWLLAVLGQLIGFFVYFLLQMPAGEAVRWALFWGVRTTLASTVLAGVIVAGWLIASPDGPPGPRGSGPMSPAG
jgi:hypothetical protein